MCTRYHTRLIALILSTIVIAQLTDSAGAEGSSVDAIIISTSEQRRARHLGKPGNAEEEHGRKKICQSRANWTATPKNSEVEIYDEG